MPISVVPPQREVGVPPLVMVVPGDVEGGRNGADPQPLA